MLQGEDISRIYLNEGDPYYFISASELPDYLQRKLNELDKQASEN